MRHVELLRELRFKAGMPTLRQISDRSGIWHSSVASILRGDTFTSEKRVKALAHALTSDEANVDEVIDAWREDSALRRRAKAVADGDTMRATENTDVEWVLIPAELHTWIEHILNGLGHRMVLLKGRTWAAVPKDEE